MSFVLCDLCPLFNCIPVYTSVVIMYVESMFDLLFSHVIIAESAKVKGSRDVPSYLQLTKSAASKRVTKYAFYPCSHWEHHKMPNTIPEIKQRSMAHHALYMLCT